MHTDFDCPDEGLLEQFLLGMLDDAQTPPLEEHLAGCPDCAGRAETLGADDDLIQSLRGNTQLLKSQGDADELAARYRLRLAVADGRLPTPAAPADLIRLDGYRVLQVLGRGGMGVVYLARHDRLKRLVALKVVAAGPHVSPGGRARFRREAELVARVRHPNVVQVYEAGEWQSEGAVNPMPYLVMEYVEGGTLAGRLSAGPLAAAAAAACLEALALGTQAVHDQGVVHRDLKPSNVLLAAGLGLGTPRISDFGLAWSRPLDPADPDTHHQTRSGAIVGTPGYMAPEQAGGDERAGPSADVWALGAILYECLTGRPPFRGESLLETLEQARTLDPVTPRRLRPGVPRDLETIALKCLEKAPAMRYATAGELAADLRRYLNGRPIHARPVGLGTRLAKWARRRPLLASLATLCLLCVTALVTGATVYEGRLRGALTSAKVEGDRADENYKAARDAVRKMLQRTRDRRWNEVPRMRHLQREQFEDALAFFDSIARQQSNDPSVRQDIAWALLEIGKVQNTLGRAEQTRDSLRRADRLTEELLTDRPDDPDARLLRADLLLTYGSILHGLKPEGVPYLEKAAALLEDLTRDFPDLSQARTGLANSLITLGGSYQSLDRNAEGERCLLRAIGLFDELILTDPDHSAVARAKARLNLAALYRAWKKGAELKQQHALAEAELERLYAKDNADRTVTRALALLRINRAYDFGAEGDHSKAFEYVSGNVPMLEAARRREPDDVELRLDLHRTHGVRATMLQHLGRKAECARAWEKSMALCQADGVHGMRYTHVSLLLDAGELTRAEAAADTLRDEIARRPTAAAWGHLAGYYEALAKATKDEPQRQRCREAAEKFKKASDGKKH